MTKLYLYNRDGATMWFERIESEVWQLKVDSKHSYCLEYLRVARNDNKEIEFVDPSGGPMLKVGDTFMDDRFKIIKIIDPVTFEIHERDNYGEDDTD